MSVTIKTDRARVAARIKAGEMAMVSAVTEQALSDCNRYAPQDCNILRASAAVNTELRNKYPIKKKLPRKNWRFWTQQKEVTSKKGALYGTSRMRRSVTLLAIRATTRTSTPPLCGARSPTMPTAKNGIRSHRRNLKKEWGNNFYITQNTLCKGDLL